MTSFSRQQSDKPGLVEFDKRTQNSMHSPTLASRVAGPFRMRSAPNLRSFVVLSNPSYKHTEEKS